MGKMSRIFFVTDVHGSDRCFRKFINSAKFYKAQHIILGGDITGKVMIPIVESGNGTWQADYLGEMKNFKKESEVDEFTKMLGDTGIYWLRVSKKELEDIQGDKSKVDAEFDLAMKNSLERWLKLAEERLKGTDATCYISVGNDDDLIVDDVLKANTFEKVVFCEEKNVSIDGHEMISFGTTNRTPWNSPREVDEDQLKKKLEELTSLLKEPGNSIFSVHVPPINSGLDTAPKIDANFKPVISGGQAVMIAAGSSAVRELIEKSQPLVGLHGHIHESRGICKLGRTVCINPGSEYGQGILRGAIVDLEPNKICDYLLVSG
ncbi:MAG: metallophosphoesterase family protein [Nitrososphaerales archaeon]